MCWLCTITTCTITYLERTCTCILLLCNNSRKIHLHRFLNISTFKLSRGCYFQFVQHLVQMKKKQDQIYSFWSTLSPLYWSLTWSESQIQLRKHFGWHDSGKCFVTMRLVSSLHWIEPPSLSTGIQASFLTKCPSLRLDDFLKKIHKHWDNFV